LGVITRYVSASSGVEVVAKVSPFLILYFLGDGLATALADAGIVELTQAAYVKIGSASLAFSQPP
jgi:hypothetical protein